MKLIKKLVAGETPSLMEASKGNELIEKINAILQLQVSPQGFGKITDGDKNLILDLTPIRDLINQLSTAVSAYSQTTGGGGGGGGGSNNAWKGPYNALLNALASSELSAECDPETRTITVSWDINLPPFQ